MTVSQADRLEAYEAFTSVVGRKVAGTLMNELKELDDGLIGLNHKVDLLAVTMTGLERAISTLANWNRVMFAMVLSLNVATLVLILQMR